MAFGIDGDPKIRSNYAGQPMLNPVAAVFFWLGVGMNCPTLATVCLPSAASLAGDNARAGNPGLGWQSPRFHPHVGGYPGDLSACGASCVWEAFSFLQGGFFRGRRGPGAAVVVASVISAALLAQGIGHVPHLF